MTGFTGNSWYVSPIVTKYNKYPPDKPISPAENPVALAENPISPIRFGLFYLCFRGHCKYDLRQDYQIVILLPKELGEFNIGLQLLLLQQMLLLLLLHLT